MKGDIKIVSLNMILVQNPFQTLFFDALMGFSLYFLHGSLKLVLVFIALSTAFDFVMRLFELKNGLEFQNAWSGRGVAESFKAKLLDAFLHAAYFSVFFYLFLFKSNFATLPIVVRIVLLGLLFHLLFGEWTAYRQRAKQNLET